MLIRTTCPQCNGVMEVDDSRDRVFCPYCGTQLVNFTQKLEVSGQIKHVIDRSGDPNLYISYATINQAITMGTKILSTGKTNVFLNGQTATFHLNSGFQEIQIRVGKKRYVRKIFIREDNAPVRINVVFDGHIHIDIDQPEFTDHTGMQGKIDNRDPGNGRSITALVFSFFPVLSIVAIILAIIDLVSCAKQKRAKHGRAVAALIIGSVMTIATIAAL